jgi:predicted nucleotidyltransferase
MTLGWTLIIRDSAARWPPQFHETALSIDPLKKPKEKGTLEEMTPLTDALLEEITRAIVETAKPRKVVLFGSRARGNAHPESDIDILVIEDEPFGPQRSRRKEMARLWHALSRFDMAKDILVYAAEEADKWKNSRNHVVAHALRTGRTLYERN